MIKKIFTRQTLYNYIEITEDYPIRKMTFGKDSWLEQGAINLVNLDEHIHDYSALAMHALLFNQNPKNVLITGLGAGIIPRHMSKYLPDTYIDVIEIDEEVKKLAEEYFYFKSNDKVIVDIRDAFEFALIAGYREKKYDIVILDAFDSHYIPFHLMGIENLRAISKIISNDSVVAINTCNIHPSFYSQANTIREVFGENLYEIKGFTNEFTSMLFAAQEGIKPLSADNVLCHFLFIKPHKFEISDDIKKSSILSLQKYVNGV